MTDSHRVSVEFEASIEPSGKINVPTHVAREFGKGGRTLRVRLITNTISAGLKDREVSEEEIERISAIQLESREQVVKFLLSEGALQKRNIGRKRKHH